MRRTSMTAALVLLVLVNGLVLAGAAWNRSGMPDATLILTERELPMSMWLPEPDGNSGISLRLRVPFRGDYAWLDEVKLRALGFDLARPEGGMVKEPLSRRAYVVLEYDGAAWAARLRQKEEALAELSAQIAKGEATEQQRKYAQQQLKRMRSQESRLVAIDAGTDAVALRARYPDGGQYLITPAEFDVGYRYRSPGESDAKTRGYIRRILVDSIHVPAAHHQAIKQAARRGANGPGYRVTLHYGRRHEPWIAGVRAVEAAPD